MVPVSLRQDEQRGALGNIVSVMPVEIPLDLDDPAVRFRYVNQKTKRMKNGRVAQGVNLFTALMGMLPASVQAISGALSSTWLPGVNMVATNVPGPQVPLYAMGKKMIAYYPYVPVGYNLGCGCAVMSYDQKLYFGLTADAKAMPDVELLGKFLDESFTELLKAAGIEQAKPFKKKSPKAAAKPEKTQRSQEPANTLKQKVGNTKQAKTKKSASIKTRDTRTGGLNRTAKAKTNPGTKGKVTRSSKKASAKSHQ
jgi:hypothetical protein